MPHVVSYSRDEPSSYDELLDRVPLPSGRFVLIAELLATGDSPGGAAS
ncbi:MAG: hypothetical protein R3B99_20475 [Polyangiales bacterium]